MTEQPHRVQRKRTKGWRMPPNTVSVTRPGFWGNPFYWKEGKEIGGKEWAKGIAVELFRDWIHNPERYPERPKPPPLPEIRRRLKGKNLACFCKADEPCHADVLLGIANS